MRKKFREYLIVDGYNVINAWEELRETAEKDLEEAREKLNLLLEEYAAFRGIFAIVVYDAYNVRSSAQRERKIGNLKIVYTKEKETADTYIEKFITALGPKRHLSVFVATDDMAEQQIALGKGGSRISTRELRLEMETVRGKIKEKTRKPTVEKNTLSQYLSRDILDKLEAIRRQS